MNALHTHMYKDSHYNALYPNRSQVSILIEQSDCFHHGGRCGTDFTRDDAISHAISSVPFVQ